MKIIKKFQGTVPGNKIMDTYSTSNTDTYACSYINTALEGVVEEGRNANGDYTKFENGILICSSYFGPITTSGNTGAQKVVNFPYTFVNNQYSCTITPLDAQAYWASVAYCVNGKTQYGFTCQTWNNGSNTNSNQYFQYIAIGRWK